MSCASHVWTALRWQGFFGCLCNTGWCGHVSDLFVRHITPLAIMPSAYQVPTISSHSRCWVEMGSPDPAVSTGLLHQLPFALPKLVSASVAALCFAVSLRRCRHSLNDLDLDSARRWSSAPTPFGRSCWRAR